MELNEKVNKLVCNSFAKEHKNSAKRNYIGASRLGVECERALQYETQNTKKNYDFEPKTLMIFETGNSFEELAHKWLLKGGFDIENKDEDGKQFGFSLFGGKVSGHCDGIVRGGPGGFEYPMLWECKSMNEKNFNLAKEDGIKKFSEVYYVQVQLYMKYFKLKRCMFTCVNKNTSEMYHDFIDLDVGVAEETLDKITRIFETISKGEMSPRKYHDKTFFKCKFCAWRDTCWVEKKIANKDVLW